MMVQKQRWDCRIQHWGCNCNLKRIQSVAPARETPRKPQTGGWPIPRRRSHPEASQDGDENN